MTFPDVTAGDEIVNHLSDLLSQRIAPEVKASLECDRDDIIRSYHAIHTPEYRKEAMASFRDGKMRVMVCTEAAGMV